MVGGVPGSTGTCCAVDNAVAQVAVARRKCDGGGSGSPPMLVCRVMSALMQELLRRGLHKGAPQAQCAHSATIWASGRTRNPYFEILGAPRGIMVTPSVDFDF